MNAVKKIKVKVPATSGNLGPGFDCMGAALTLYNEVELELNVVSDEKASTFSPHLSIEIIGEGSKILPRDSSNIIVVAIFEIFKRFNSHLSPFTKGFTNIPSFSKGLSSSSPFSKGGLRGIIGSGRIIGSKKEKSKGTCLKLKLINRIPLARGLGSSAAARVAGLLAANHICGNPLSKEELLNLGAKLEGHPDNVAPALYGNICLSGNTDNRFWSYTISRPPKNIKAVVCVPDFELSTAKARRTLPERYTREDAVFNISRAALLVNALMSKRFELLGLAMEDRLHQPYRAKLVPGLHAVCQAARSAGAYNAVLSGAGPTVLAIAEGKGGIPEKAGQAMTKEFAQHKVKSRYLVLDFDNKGATIFK